jgi:hypothetical protein
MTRRWDDLAEDISAIHDYAMWVREKLHTLDSIREQLEFLMAGQASIDAATAAILNTQANQAAAVTILQADVTAIRAELDAGAGDTTALDSAVAAQPASDAALTAAVNDVTALAPPPAA